MQYKRYSLGVGEIAVTTRVLKKAVTRCKVVARAAEKLSPALVLPHARNRLLGYFYDELQLQPFHVALRLSACGWKAIGMRGVNR